MSLNTNENTKLSRLSFSSEQGLFDDSGFEPIVIPDGEIGIYRNFFSKDESDRFFPTLCDEVKWRQDKITYYAKEIALPRLTAWYGDPGKRYTYSGISMSPEPWLPSLISIKEKVEEFAQVKFNSVLLNLYRDGKDSVSWHSDDEAELGKCPTIASVSFGETRPFQLKHKYNQKLAKISINLAHGSFLLMKGTTQQFWLHQIPKTSKAIKPRINLTFRIIN